MIKPVSFMGNVYLTKRVNRRSKINEINKIREYADKNEADVFVIERNGNDEKTNFEALATKNGQIFYKKFVPYNMKNSITRTLDGVRLAKDPIGAIEKTNERRYTLNEVKFINNRAWVGSGLLSGKIDIKIEDYLYELSYNNGKITESSKFEADGLLVSKKIYSYDKNGSLEHIITYGEETKFIKYDREKDFIVFRDENYKPVALVSKNNDEIRFDKFE